MLALALMSMMLQEAPPRGINDSVIGTAEEYAIQGPARVCFNHGAFDLVAGEVSHLDYLGIHWAGIRVTGPGGTYTVREGDIWAVRGRGRPVSGLPRVRRFGSRYAVYGRPDFSADRERLLYWFDGVRGSNSERVSVLKRAIAVLEDKSGCSRRFVYGLFFDEDDVK